MLGKSSDSCVGRRDASQLNGMEDSRRRSCLRVFLLCALVFLAFAERRLAELDFDSTGVVRIENNDKPDGDEIINRLVFVDDAKEPVVSTVGARFFRCHLAEVSRELDIQPSVVRQWEAALRRHERGRGVAPVRWTVNCFRDRHRTLSEGGTEIAPPVSIVDSEGTVRSLGPRARS